MRNASFFYTEQQVLDETKDVTRRLNWHWAKVGMRLQAVRKGMGRKAGEPLTKLKVIEIVSVRRERLDELTAYICREKDKPIIYTEEQARDEVRREGFADVDPVFGFPSEFVRIFCEHMNCTPDREVARVEFKYVN